MTADTTASSAVRTIGMMAPGWPPGSLPNGILTSVGIVREELMRRGLCVKIFTGKPLEGLEDPDIVDLRDHRDPNSRHSFTARVLRRVSPMDLRQRLIAEGMLAGLSSVGRDAFDLVEMEESFGAVGKVAAAMPCPVVARLHGPWFLNGEALGVPHDARFARRVALEGKGIAQVAGVSAPSQDTLDRTLAHYGLEPSHAAVIYNPQPPMPAHQHWSLDECDRNTILFIGRFDRHKGGDVMIDAFAHLAAKFPELRLQFAGPDRGFLDSKGRNWSLAEYAAARLTAPGVAERFEWLGLQPHDDLRALRQRAMITVVPSRFETFGNTATEAMAQGCPVVAADGGGLAEVVRDGHSGLLSRAGDAGDLAEKIGDLLENAARASQLGINAITDCAERFAPSIVAEHTLDFYARLERGGTGG